MLKILKRLRRWRNSSGFTLIEVIVASALLGVLLVGVLGFVQPVLRSVATKEQNARAVMLAESVYSYISSSLRNAFYVQPLVNVVSSDTKTISGTKPNVRSVAFTNTDASSPYMDSHNGETLERLWSFYKGLDPDFYEIRCIGIRWVTDGKTGEKKLVLTNEYVTQGDGDDTKNLALDDTKYKLVFETCFYDGLYPIITVENYNNQYVAIDAAGNEVPQVADADLKLASGLKVKTDVFLTADCYNTNAGKRATAVLNYEGVGYADLPNIKSNLINTLGQYRLQPNIQIRSYDDALALSSTATYTMGSDTYYYPDTFIYYVTRKAVTNL